VRKLRVLFAAHSMEAGTAMGGSNANALIVQGLMDHPLVEAIAITTPDEPKRGADLLIVEAPTGAPFIRGCEPKYTYVLRHGDTPVGDCGFECFEDGVAAFIVPTQWAARGLPRVPYVVQYMALEPPAALSNGVLPPLGKRVLHARAFDFMKGTGLALAVARAALQEPGMPSFVFRLSPQVDEVKVDVPPNVELLRAVGGDALWRDIGCVLLTSRDETFSMIAYEAMGRGIPVVCHASLGAVKEWAGHLPLYVGHETALASACRNALRASFDFRLELRTRAQVVHEKAVAQLGRWLEEAAEKVGT
jgi:hypothetical protein